jgi:hypothetical protein
MIYLFYAALIFIAGLLFLPTEIGSGPRNLPLLIALILLYLLYLTVRFIKYVLLVRKTEKLLKSHGYEVERVKIRPFSARFRGTYSLLAKKQGVSYSFFFLLRKHRGYRYHFESRERLEFYASNRLMIIGRGRFYSHRTIMVQTRLAGKHRLDWQSPSEKSPTFILVMNQFPDVITDEKTFSGSLGNGDLICDTVHLYDFSGFSEAVKDEKLRGKD